ncbi:unnamed protein product, partial [Closterium sp. NIES-65]
KLASYTAPKELLHELPRGEAEEEVAWLKEPSHIIRWGSNKKPSRIIDREDDCRRRCLFPRRFKKPSRIIDREDDYRRRPPQPDYLARPP